MPFVAPTSLPVGSMRYCARRWFCSGRVGATWTIRAHQILTPQNRIGNNYPLHEAGRPPRGIR